MSEPAFWTVERTRHRRFPFRVAIEQDGRTVLAVRAQSAWPGPGQQVFCLRERGLDADEPLDPVERVPVRALTRVGRKLGVVLDRPMRKRCEFLAIQRVTKSGEKVEQLFFRTQSGIKAHRSRARVELLPAEVAEQTVAIDAAERYPWRFPGARIVRRPLGSGDYALLAAGRVQAVVERKTFDGLLSDIGAIQSLHQQLADLATAPLAAVVVEAQYGDFLDPARLAGRWPPAHLARVLAEIAVMHPRLPVVFAGNRKLANAWCARFFAACALRETAPQLELVAEPRVREMLAQYQADEREPNVDDRIRAAALARAGGFQAKELAAELAGVSAVRIRRELERLREEGLLEKSGRGRGTRWIRLGR